MNQTTSFTWGYDDWGNHTPQLVVTVDAAESRRWRSEAKNTILCRPNRFRTP
jgi:hypothetical protein